MSGFAEEFGPWAVVTGAAQGVGLAFVQELHERGVGAVMVDVHPDLAEIADGLDGETIAVPADLSDPAWVAALEAAAGNLDVGLVVANAGLSRASRFVDEDADYRHLTIAVNATAAADLVAWGCRRFAERGGGGVITMSSGSALAGTGGFATYSATKAFLVNLTEAVGWEMRDQGVKVQALIGPSMTTPAFNSSGADHEAMGAPPVDPRSVVSRSLDALGNGPVRWLADDGLAFVANADRADQVELLGGGTAAMYPHILGR